MTAWATPPQALCCLESGLLGSGLLVKQVEGVEGPPPTLVTVAQEDVGRLM